MRDRLLELISLTDMRDRLQKSIPLTDMRDRLPSWFGTFTAIKSGWLKLVLWVKTSILSK
jgi:hypothetical protein